MGVEQSFQHMLKGVPGIAPYKKRNDNDWYHGKYGVTLHPDYDEEKYITSFGPTRIFSLTNAVGQNLLIDAFGHLENLPHDMTRFGSMVSTIYETLSNTRTVRTKGANVRSRDNFAACNFYLVFALHLNYQLKGYSDAAATSIGDAYRRIKHGENDLLVAGGIDYITNEVGYENMKKFGIITHEGEDYKLRPYDQASQGAAAGSTGSLLLLEDLEHALKRNAKIYGEITGFGMSPHGKFAASEFGNG
jgi:3-oxoacyl-(acyl-carrier-protein) synthase